MLPVRHFCPAFILKELQGTMHMNKEVPHPSQLPSANFMLFICLKDLLLFPSFSEYLSGHPSESMSHLVCSSNVISITRLWEFFLNAYYIQLCKSTPSQPNLFLQTFHHILQDIHILGMTDTRQAYGYTPLRKTSTNAEERDQLSKFSWLSFVLHITFWKKNTMHILMEGHL